MLDVMLCFGNIMESNMNNEIRAAMQLFENKLASLWQIDGQLMECADDDRAYRMENRQRVLEREVDAARENLINAINKLEQKSVVDDWEDRMGGQFTQEEIDRAARGGEGW